jgi:hypothetical protein
MFCFHCQTQATREQFTDWILPYYHMAEYILQQEGETYNVTSKSELLHQP